MRGLGDIVSDVIKAVAPNIEECEGCKKRKAKLNKFSNKLMPRFKNNLNGVFR